MSVQLPDKAQLLLDSIPAPPFDVVHPKSKRLIARITQDSILIQDEGKKEYIYRQGINIPPFLRERFNNVNGVSVGDSFFREAFITAQCWHFLRDGYKIEKKESSSTESAG